MPRASTAPKQSWDAATFFEHAAHHRPATELDLLRKLVDRATATGGRVIWRRRGLPGASVWYDIVGELIAVFGFSAGDVSTPAHVLLYLESLPSLLLADQLARVRAELHPTNAGEQVWMTRLVLLSDLTTKPDEADSLFRLISVIVGQPPLTI